MRQSYGALVINNNTTPSRAPNAAAVHTQGWAAHGVSQHGDQSVPPTPATGKLTLVPGVYQIVVSLAIETEDISGTSGDGVGLVSAQLYKGGSAVGGTKRTVSMLAVDRPQSIHIEDIVEITEAQAEAGTNYVQLFLSSGDASGNDVTVTNAIFAAYRKA